MLKVISYCLWGNDPKYVVGMQRNIELAAKIYPEWIVSIQFGCDMIDTMWELGKFADSLGVVLDSTWHEKSDWTLMLDRFVPEARRYDVVISRDADSRLTPREKAAVDQWLASDKGIHIMHDHPYHAVPMLGGMWGYKQGAIPGFHDLLAGWNAEDRWQTDQEFLAQRIWPLIQHDVMNHDSFFGMRWHGIPFPTPRIGHEFVGATIDEHEQYVPEQVRELKRYI